MKLVAVSLFAGIGGFDLALRNLGVDTVVACEIDVRCQVVLKHHFPAAYIHGDIRTLTAKIINSEIKKRYGRARIGVVIVGGFPCQPFSQAGQQGGTDDPRHLWPEMSRLVWEMQPLCVVAENVPGMLGDKFAVAFEAVCTQMEAAGLTVQAVDIPASSINAPHIRQRVFFAANARGDGDGREIVAGGLKSGKRRSARRFTASSGVSIVAPNPQSQRFGKEGRDSADSEEWLGRPNPLAPVPDDFQRGQQLQLFGSEPAWPWEEPDRGLEERDNSDAKGKRSGEIRDAEEAQGDGSCDEQPARLHGGEGVSSKPSRKRAQGLRPAGLRGTQVSAGEGLSGRDDSGNFWENFPTESPIFNRDDGFSLRVDIERVRIACRPTRKSLSESEANNSVNVFGLHAAGNAVVPQQAQVVLGALFQSNGWLGLDGKVRASL